MVRGALLLPFKWKKTQRLRKLKRGRGHSPGTSHAGALVGMRERTRTKSELVWDGDWGQ